MNLRWLMMAKRWADKPPPLSRVIFVFAIVAICIVAAVYEHYYGWPEFLTVPDTRGVKIK